MRKITQEELNEILEKHNKWLNDEKGGERAILDDVDLNGASLDGASLNCASLDGASLRGASLNRASLNDASLNDASLNDASLIGASLNRASLIGASLDGAIGVEYPIACPEEGEFIGFKKARNGYIVKLKITEDAKRCSATGRKCRCSKALVLSITKADGTDDGTKEITSLWDRTFIYRIGDIVEVSDFCEDRWEECAPGIHFFVTRKEAEKYNV